MKFNLSSIVVSVALLAVPALGQRARLSYPHDGTTVRAGSNLIVEVDRPDTLSGSTEVGVVIAVNPCNNGVCQSPDVILGQILYNGPFHPKFQSSAIGYQIPGQNFTINIPSSINKGRASLNVFHVALIGAGQAIPLTETLNVTINIA